MSKANCFLEGTHFTTTFFNAKLLCWSLQKLIDITTKPKGILNRYHVIIEIRQIIVRKMDTKTGEKSYLLSQYFSL